MTAAVHRLFIALTPDQETRQALMRLRARTVSHLNEIRWIPRDNWHVTLHFLGACPPRLKDRLAQEFSAQSGDFTSLLLTGRQLQGFPHEQRPGRVWALSLEHDQALAQWHARLGRWLEPLGVSVETRALKAHITLARSQKVRHWPVRAAPLTCCFDRLALYESVATPQGPIYQSLSAAGTSA